MSLTELRHSGHDLERLLGKNQLHRHCPMSAIHGPYATSSHDFPSEQCSASFLSGMRGGGVSISLHYNSRYARMLMSTVRIAADRRSCMLPTLLCYRGRL
jgi:hypothetical protein